MSVTYFEEEKIFQLDTKNTSYVIGITDQEQLLGHVYYGKKIRGRHSDYLLRTKEEPYLLSGNQRERVMFLDRFPVEYSGHGVGDYRESSLEVLDEEGHSACSFVFRSYQIVEGKPEIPGLPEVRGMANDCTTLLLTCWDPVLSLEAELRYAVYPKEDVITRSVVLKNISSKNIGITKVMSMSLDLENEEYDLITLPGAWAREREVVRRKIVAGQQGIRSTRGETSHQAQPFLGIVSNDAGEASGEVYGMLLVYSGNFLAQTELDSFGMIRIVLGIHPEDFRWSLAPGEVFYTPEAVLTYSDQGIGQMSRNYHDIFRNHLMQERYQNQKRPVLINNWEATYFDFTTEKLLLIAKRAKALGIEMLVMDDGWFGKRKDDTSSLGDWFVNEEKLPGGLASLVSQVNQLGLEFGIWMEPEMISPDSDLYQEHPDWALQIPNRTPAMSRCQYVLDIGRKEVREEVYRRIYHVLSSAPVTYLKWDMNRQLTDLGSSVLPAGRQGEIAHRYVLGVYELQERLLHDFPALLLENCSGGGGRFDAGMLSFSPQIWCSDDTDAIERLSIQRGTAMLYPLSATGAHISACPNHQTGRQVPFETRGFIALAGTFGYELDVTKIPEEEQNQIPAQIALYHQYNELIRRGDYYRIASYAENHEYDCYGVVSKDKSEALFTYIQVMSRPNYRSRKIRLIGLDPDADYLEERSDRIYGGDLLMNAGILLERMKGDFTGMLIHLTVQ